MKGEKERRNYAEGSESPLSFLPPSPFDTILSKCLAFCFHPYGNVKQIPILDSEHLEHLS